jgi:hypothetical protein
MQASSTSRDLDEVYDQSLAQGGAEGFPSQPLRDAIRRWAQTTLATPRVHRAKQNTRL